MDGYSFNIAVSVIAIMIAIGGICIGLGYALNNKRLKEFGIDELYQSLVNGALIGGFLLLFLPSGVISSLISSLTLPGNSSVQCPQYLSQNSAICFAYGYLSGSGYVYQGSAHPSILSQSTGLIVDLFALNTLLGVVASININLDVISFSPGVILNPILNQLQSFIKSLSTISISVLVQSAILSAIAASATTILLPIGLILRTFFATRKIGGFLIGLTLGLYVVFPLSYVLNASIISSYSVSISNSTIENLSNSASGLNIYTNTAILSTKTNSSIISYLTNGLQSITNLFSSFISQITNYISYFIMAAFILPAFSVALTLVSIKEFSDLLGAEIHLGLFNMV